LRSNSPGRSTLVWSPVTKSTAATSRGAPSRGQSLQRPSRATTSEIIAPAGSDMQILPPTVAAFQILNEARRALQQARISGAATHFRGASKR